MELLEKVRLKYEKYNKGHNKLTDKSIELLSKQKWENLVSLHLEKNEITDKGIEALMQLKFPQLISLRLSIRLLI